MQNARIAIVSADHRAAENLRDKLSERGYSAAVYTAANASAAMAPSARGPVLLIVDPSRGKIDARKLTAEAKEKGAKSLVLNHLNGLDQLDEAVNSGADFSWPAEAVEHLPDNLEALLKDDARDTQSASPTLLKSVYLSASAISAHEQSLLADPAELASRLAHTEAQIEQMRKEMESFTYSVSHDLRAPLRAIEGFTRILTEDYGNQLEAEGQKFLSYVVANSQQLGRLIDDLLVYHRLAKAPLVKTEVDTTDLVKDVMAEQRSLDKKTPARTITVEIPNLLPANADPNLLRQAFTQYISNALKFTRLNTNTRIEVGSYTDNDEHVYFVKDNGIGFDMQYASKLFQVFQKLQRQDEYEGNGIGLAIVQRIIQRHGGRVWAEAEPDRGATFYFSLPAK